MTLLPAAADAQTPRRVKDIASGPAASAPRNLTDVAGTLFFTAKGSELWKSDGTAAGTVLVKAIGSNPYALTNIAGTLYFFADNGLWKSNGTTGGTVLVKALTLSATHRWLFPVGTRVFFAAGDATHGEELWTSDGTAAGTVLVKDINPIGDSAPDQPAALAGKLIFSATNGTVGVELWKSDGTSGGTVMIKDINGSGSSSPVSFVAFGSSLYFGANDGTSGYELWKTDGTLDGTKLVRDIFSGAPSGFATPQTIVSSGSDLFFTGNDGTTGAEPWRSDGSFDGTFLLRNIVAGSGGSAPHTFTNVGGSVFITATQGAQTSLWKSDGTNPGTVLLMTFASATKGVNGRGRLYFGADDGTGKGVELWSSDGTTSNTDLVADIRPGPASGFTGNLTLSGSKLFFTADDGTSGEELWVLDLTVTDLSITKTDGSSTAIAGGRVTYTIQVSNLGSDTATGASVVDTLPAALTGATWTCAGTGGGTCTASGSGGIDDTVTLPGGASVTYTLTATVSGPAGGTVTNTASVTAPGRDPNAANDSASDTDTIIPTLSIDDVVATEGNGGTKTFTFTVTLSAPSTHMVTVSYATADGTATVADGDYAAASGTVTFSPGATSAAVPVTVFGDLRFEPDESFFVNLSAPSNAAIARGQGRGTILNDDPMPTLSIDDAQVTEGDTGSVPATFTVRLSAVSGAPTTVAYATADGTATAASGDYAPVSGILTIPAGSLAGTITVNVLGDTAPEPAETFFVNLGSPTNATLADPQGQGTIRDNDRRTLCSPIVSLPYTISAQGSYCLVQNLSTAQASGNAITIDSDFVVLDLKGFKIGGGAAGAGTDASGVYALNRRNITIRNGNIRGFRRAVFLEDDSGTLTASQGSLVEGVRADGNTEEGIHVQGRGATVRRNHVTATGGTTLHGANADAYGIRLEGAAGRVIDNDVFDTLPPGVGAGVAIELTQAPSAVVEKNRAAGSAAIESYGIRMVSGTDVLVLGNRISGARFAIRFEAATGRYRDNLVTGAVTPYSGGTDAGNNQ